MRVRVRVRERERESEREGGREGGRESESEFEGNLHTAINYLHCLQHVNSQHKGLRDIRNKTCPTHHGHTECIWIEVATQSYSHTYSNKYNKTFSGLWKLSTVYGIETSLSHTYHHIKVICTGN